MVGGRCPLPLTLCPSCVQGTLLLNNIHKAPKSVLPLLKQTVDTASRGSMDDGEDEEQQHRCVGRKGRKACTCSWLVCLPPPPCFNLAAGGQQASLHRAQQLATPPTSLALPCVPCLPWCAMQPAGSVPSHHHDG
jgi:hypothetical protein